MAGAGWATCTKSCEALVFAKRRPWEASFLPGPFLLETLTPTLSGEPIALPDAMGHGRGKGEGLHVEDDASVGLGDAVHRSDLRHEQVAERLQVFRLDLHDEVVAPADRVHGLHAGDALDRFIGALGVVTCHFDQDESGESHGSVSCSAGR